MKVREVVMRSVSHQKRFMGLTVACVATIVTWGVLGQGTAFGQTDQQETTFQNTALADTNADRENYSNAGELGLTLDDSLNAASRDWALHLVSIGKLEHSDSEGAYGENLFEAIDTANLGPDDLAHAMVKAWYDERFNYDADAPVNVSATGHYTQLVWKSTTAMGCGYAIGSYFDPITGIDFNVYYGVCRYTPAGNVSGEYAANVPAQNSGVIASVFHFLPSAGNHSLSEALDLTGGGNTASSKQGQGATF